MVHNIYKLCIEEFQWVTIKVGKNHSYLGMQLEFLSGVVHIDMQNYIGKILQEFAHGLEEYHTPGSKDLFTVLEGSSELDNGGWQQFHTAVAKLLYLLKRVQPDIIIVVSFLCTKVKALATEDKEKIMHLLGYLQRTKRRTLILRPQKISKVQAFVDESFAAYMDEESHTSMILMIGGAGVFFVS
jgi:hypothetical protein